MKEYLTVQYCDYRKECIHTEKCFSCPYNTICYGINKNYYKAYGDSEIGFN